MKTVLNPTRLLEDYGYLMTVSQQGSLQSKKKSEWKSAFIASCITLAFIFDANKAAQAKQENTEAIILAEEDTVLAQAEEETQQITVEASDLPDENIEGLPVDTEDIIVEENLSHSLTEEQLEISVDTTEELPLEIAEDELDIPENIDIDEEGASADAVGGIFGVLPAAAAAFPGPLLVTAGLIPATAVVASSHSSELNGDTIIDGGTDSHGDGGGQGQGGDHTHEDGKGGDHTHENGAGSDGYSEGDSDEDPEGDIDLTLLDDGSDTGSDQELDLESNGSDNEIDITGVGDGSEDIGLV